MPRRVPRLRTDDEAEAFLEQDRSDLDFSQFKPVRFEFEKKAELGYGAGPLGAIDDPRASAAIRQVQREMGWAVTGEPGHPLLKILLLRLKLMVS